MSTFQIVTAGPYFGFTKAQLEAELARYVAQVQASGSDLAGASVNGQSFTFGPRRDWSIEQWQLHLQGALAQIDPDRFPPPPSNGVAMRLV